MNIKDYTAQITEIYNSDGRVVRASASGTVDLGFDSESGQTNYFELVFTASLFDAQH